jgi:iron complex transport system ATP-binding protein
MISVSCLTLYKGERIILNDISLEIQAHRFTSIIGRNGAGKSTFLSILSGEEKNYQGKVEIFGRNIRELSIGEMAQYRAILPQQSESGFSFTAEEIIRLGAYPHNHQGSKINDTLEMIVDELKLSPLRNRNIQTLSGGERQIINFARTLMQVFLSEHETPFILLDEPANNLDLSCQQEIFSLLKNLCLEKKLSVIAIIHDINLAAQYSDDFILLKNGQLLECSSAEYCLKADKLENALGHPVEVVYHSCSNCPLIIPRKQTLTI